MSNEKKMCVSCDVNIQYKDSKLCKSCFNTLKFAQRNILILSSAIICISSETAKKEILEEIGKNCYNEIYITKNIPELRIIKKNEV